MVSLFCTGHSLDPSSCDVIHVLNFLQELLVKGRTPSMLKVYVAANHAPVADRSIWQNNLIVKFLRGAGKLNFLRPHSVPIWDLSIILNALRCPPFEPLQSLKSTLLLALASV